MQANHLNPTQESEQKYTESNEDFLNLMMLVKQRADQGDQNALNQCKSIYGRLAKELKSCKKDLLESTGGLEKMLLAFCHDIGALRGNESIKKLIKATDKLVFKKEDGLTRDIIQFIIEQCYDGRTAKLDLQIIECSQITGVELGACENIKVTLVGPTIQHM